MIDYNKFYGFSENPFDISPDPKFFFPSETHGEALASLRYGIENRKGFILILGEAGVGKTTLIYHLINTLDEKVKPIFFPQSQLPFEQMLKEMLIGLKLSPGSETKGSMIHELYEHLIACLARDEKVAVILDEAENIGLDVIEEVRLLANLETSTSKLLQIILVGKPELREKLLSQVIRQIKQRIVIVCRIKPLSEKESRQYIDHRLKIVGRGAAEVFTDEALSLICRSAKGVPLAINILCSNALSVGSGLPEKKISAATVKKIRREKNILTPERAQILVSGIKRRLPRKIFYSVIVLIPLAMALFFSRNYVQRVFNKQELSNSLQQSTAVSKASSPEIALNAAADIVSTSANPKAIDAAPETSKVSVAPPAPVDHSNIEIRPKKIVEVKQGINLYSLAYQFYRVADETMIDHILKLNPEIRNPHLILVSQKIKIPEITESLLIIRYSDDLYKIHLRTFTNLKSANQYRHDAGMAGKDLEIVPWKVSPSETWYRVMAGPFVSRGEASKALQEMKQNGFSIIPLKQVNSKQ